MALDTEKKFRNGKEITVVRLKHQPKQKQGWNPDDEEFTIEEQNAILAMYYPQYTIQELYSVLPDYQVRAMWQALRKEQANNWLIFDTIVNAANTKDHKSYKSLMRKLVKTANPKKEL